MMYVIDDLRFSVMTYIFATKDYSWGNEIIMEEIEMSLSRWKREARSWQSRDR